MRSATAIYVTLPIEAASEESKILRRFASVSSEFLPEEAWGRRELWDKSGFELSVYDSGIPRSKAAMFIDVVLDELKKYSCGKPFSIHVNYAQMNADGSSKWSYEHDGKHEKRTAEEEICGDFVDCPCCSWLLTVSFDDREVVCERCGRKLIKQGRYLLYTRFDGKEEVRRVKKRDTPPKRVDGVVGSILNLREANPVSRAPISKEERRLAELLKRESQTHIAEQLVARIIEDCQKNASFLTLEEIRALVTEAGLPDTFFRRYIAEKYGKTVRKFFEDADVIKSLKNVFDDTLTALKKRYETRPRVFEVAGLISDNADIDLAVILNYAKEFTHMTTKELLLSEGILIAEPIPDHAEMFVGVLHMPGNEPEDVKRRLERLFAKLDVAYPDKVIEGLNRDHKKWGEEVVALYRLLGYANRNNFLMAYGYTVANSKGGRTANKNEEIIAELQRRYPKGASFTCVAQLKRANPDLAPKIKSLENAAQGLYGMSLKNYLISLHILISATKDADE